MIKLKDIEELELRTEGEFTLYCLGSYYTSYIVNSAFSLKNKKTNETFKNTSVVIYQYEVGPDGNFLENPVVPDKDTYEVFIERK